jgi:hypothetical protein
MHTALTAEATRPARASLAARQRRFGALGAEFGGERPHEVLGNDTPADS